jgi:VWFA-related protein
MMKHALALFVLLLTCAPAASAQAEAPPWAPGRPEELAGVSRVYVTTPTPYGDALGRVVKTLRRKEPRLTLVTTREEAEVCLVFTIKRTLVSERRVTPAPPGEYGSATNTVTYSSEFVLRGRVGVVGNEAGPPRLVRTFERGGELNVVTEKFAEDFIKAYREANPGPPTRADTRPREPLTTAPRLEAGGPRPASPSGSAEARDAAPREVSEDEVVRVETSLVTVHASVQGRDGLPVAGLRREDFRVAEDGREQEIAFFETVERPFNVVLVVDTSPSTRRKMGDIAAAANAFVESLRDDDVLAVVTFDGEVREAVKPSKVRDLRGRGLNLTAGRGSTRLYDAVNYVSIRYLARARGRKAVVLLTDGVDETSMLATAEENLSEVEELDALFYTVRYDTMSDTFELLKQRRGRPLPAYEYRLKQQHRDAEVYLRELARKTGGRFYEAGAAGGLAPAFASIVEELGRHYSLGYYPRPGAGEGRRRVEVRVNAPGHVVRARDGYVYKAPEAGRAAP